MILLATDFSEVSGRARDFACTVARGLGCGVHLLHVIEPVDEPGSSDPDTEAFYRQLEDQARDSMAREVEAVKPLEASSSILVAPRYQGILDKAGELGVQAIVLGTHPLKDSAPAYVGTSHKVAWKADRPVILVP